VVVGLVTWRVDRFSPVPNVILPGGLGVGVGVGLGVGDPACEANGDGDGCSVGVCEVASPTVGCVGLIVEKMRPSKMA